MTLCRSQSYEDRCHLLQGHEGKHRSPNGVQWEGEYRYAGHAIVTLSQDEYGHLVRTFENPPEPTQKLRDLMKIDVPPQTLKRLEVRTEQATDYRAQRDALMETLRTLRQQAVYAGMEDTPLFWIAHDTLTSLGDTSEFEMREPTI